MSATSLQSSNPTELFEAVRRLGAEVAAPAAGDVDKNSRFPREAIEAAKQARLLGALVPKELGGLGLGLADAARTCELLGQHCSSAAMVLAMHHIQVACLVRHGLGSPYFRAYLSELCERQLLIASVTSEQGVGGDTRSSVCALEPGEGGFALRKEATTISYGEHADDLLVTCRRGPDSPPSDQALVLLRKGGFTLERKGSWDTLGMRGTCSPGALLTSRGVAEQALATPFAEISAETMVPTSHILWAHVWLGITTEAVQRARGFVRGQARRTPGVVPPSAGRLAELWIGFQQQRTAARDSAAGYERILRSPEPTRELTSLGFALQMNNLKVAASQQVAQLVTQALLICGIAGYKNDGPFSLGRQLRDAHSAALMVSNDRILAGNAALLLVHKEN